MLTSALIFALAAAPDAPWRPHLAPSELPARSGVLTASPTPAPLPVASLTLGGAGVVFLGAGVALLISGLNVRSSLLDATSPTGISSLRGSEARALNDSASVQLGLAGASGVLALALAGVALALW